MKVSKTQLKTLIVEAYKTGDLYADDPKFSEEALDKRDAEVERILIDKLNTIREEVNELRYHERGLMKEAKRILDAARNEQWWELTDLLGRDTVETLSEISPTNILSDYNNDF